MRAGSPILRCLLLLTRCASSLRNFNQNGPALHEELKATFLTRDRDEWVEKLEAAGVLVAPVQAPEEVVVDPQVAAALVDVPGTEGGRTLPSPVDFSEVIKAPLVANLLPDAAL